MSGLGHGGILSPVRGGGGIAMRLRLAAVMLTGGMMLLGCGHDSHKESHHASAGGRDRTRAVAVSTTGERKATCVSCQAHSPCTRPSDVNAWVNEHSKEHSSHTRYSFEDCPK